MGALTGQPNSPASFYFEQLYMSGVTFFTLGYRDSIPHSPAARLVAVLEAGTGIGFIAVALLCSHAEPEALPVLDHLLRDWEFSSAELIEIHLSYPMLAFYRSQHDNQSWLAALCAIMDCCALILVGVQGVPPLQARMTFAIARQVVVEMSRAVPIQPSRWRHSGQAMCRCSAARLGACRYHSLAECLETPRPPTGNAAIAECLPGAW